MLKGIKAIISRFFSVWVKNLYLFTSLVWKSLNISQLYQEKAAGAPAFERLNRLHSCIDPCMNSSLYKYCTPGHPLHTISQYSTHAQSITRSGRRRRLNHRQHPLRAEPSRAWSPRCASTAGDTGPKNVNPRSVTTELHASSGLTLRMKKCPCFVHGDQDVNGINLFLVRRELKVSIALCSFCRNAR